MAIPLNMQATILRRSLVAGGIGIPGAFGAHLDVAPLAALWTEMLLRLAGQADQEMEKAKAAKIVAGVLAGIGTFKMGFKAANTYFAYTGVGTIPGDRGERLGQRSGYLPIRPRLCDALPVEPGRRLRREHRVQHSGPDGLRDGPLPGRNQHFRVRPGSRAARVRRPSGSAGGHTPILPGRRKVP
jgi:hypothetical protein